MRLWMAFWIMVMASWFLQKPGRARPSGASCEAMYSIVSLVVWSRGVMGMTPLCAMPTVVLVWVMRRRARESVSGNGWQFSGQVPPCVVMRKCRTTPVAVRSRLRSSLSRCASRSESFMKPLSMRTLPSCAYMTPAPSGLPAHMVRMVSRDGILRPPVSLR